MDYDKKTTPSMAEIALALIFVLCLAVVWGGASWQMPCGCVVLGSGAWASWKVGRWVWWRFAPTNAAGAMR